MNRPRKAVGRLSYGQSASATEATEVTEGATSSVACVAFVARSVTVYSAKVRQQFADDLGLEAKRAHR